MSIIGNAVSYIIAGIMGVLLHFLNDLVPVPTGVKFFVATDESVFEHLKLFFFPVMAVTLGQYLIDRRYKENSPGLKQRIGNRSIATLFIIVVQIIFFYAYTSFIPSNPIIDIIGYFVFLAAIFIISYLFDSKDQPESSYGKELQKKTGTAAFIVTLLFLVIFTYYKPELPLFTAP